MNANNPIFIDFRIPKTTAQLANYIGVPESILIKLSDPVNKLAYFSRHQIPKKNSPASGEYRVVWEADPFLADAYKSFNRRFDMFAKRAEYRYPHSAAYGYLRGRSTIDNASPHCKAPLILHADIKDYFPSITKDRLLELFKKLGINPVVANLLCEFVCINDKLPLGIHCSPLLANLVCLDLDDKFVSLSAKYDCQYTRYADDITISGKTVPTKEEVEKILKEEGFLLSQRKFKITKAGQSHYVTGLSVANSYPRIPRKMKQKLRQELYYCKKFGIEEHIDRIDIKKDYDYIQRGVNRIDGMVRYIFNVEQAAMPKLRTSWEELLNDQGFEVSYPPIGDREHRPFVFYIDETEIHYAGKKYLALCLVQANQADVKGLENVIDIYLKDHIEDPFAGGNKEALMKKGLHYADCNEDLRNKFINAIPYLPCRAYLAYTEISDKKTYEDAYLSLIEGLLPYRLMACDNSFTHLVFEENSSIKEKRIIDLVSSLQEKLKAENNRRPLLVSSSIGKKLEHPLFALPDYFLAVFSNYATDDGTKGDRRNLFFERIRDKYRVILDLDKNILFSRKRPFMPFQFWKKN